MWKYVGALKDSVEQTCSHIKNLRSTFCTSHSKTVQDRNKESVRRFETTNDGRNYNIWKCLEQYGPSNEQKPFGPQNRNPFDIDAPYVIQRCYQKQKQKQQQHACSGSMELSFWQWTAGILCSLYFGQMMCFYSRQRQNMKRWHHMEQILSERTLKQTLERFNQHYTVYQKSFVPSNDQNHWIEDVTQMRRIRALMPLAPVQCLPVANDHFNLKQDQPNINTFSAATQTSSSETEISQAVDELIATLGSIEFKLGMQNIRANEPEVAVSHLKLAATHHHPEATFNLGICYELGFGVRMNLKSAMECYRAAAGLGHKTALYNLGVFYVQGRGGLTKNRDAARACFEAADKMGSLEAKKALTLPEKPPKKDDEIQLKSHGLIADRLSTVRHRRESSVI